MNDNPQSQRSESKVKERAMIVRSLRLWGDIASDAILSPKVFIFTVLDIDGLIGYRLENHCAIVLGNPVCEEKDLVRLAMAFEEFCKQNKYSCIYAYATGTFSAWAIDNLCQAYIQVANEVFINPQEDITSQTGRHASLVRRKIRHAEKEGVGAFEFFNDSEKIQQDLKRVRKEWLENRKGPQIHISDVLLFDDSFGKRWFYAMREQKIEGVVVLNELKKRQGWLLNHLMVVPDAPHGTQELLVVTALKAVAKENCSLVTFGNVAVDQLQINGLGKMASWLAKKGYSITRSFFHLQGHLDFWDKFNPQLAPSYLLFDTKHITLSQLFALKKVLHMKFF